MCSALKCIGRCLQGRPGVCGNLQAVKTAHLSSCPPVLLPPVLLSSCPPVLLSASPACRRSLQTPPCSLWREHRGLCKELFARRRAWEDLTRRRQRKRGQSKISLWRCTLRAEGLPEF